MMNALTNHPDNRFIDTPITSVHHHKQHPWDVNFFDKIRGAIVKLEVPAAYNVKLRAFMLPNAIFPGLSASWDLWPVLCD